MLLVLVVVIVMPMFGMTFVSSVISMSRIVPVISMAVMFPVMLVVIIPLVISTRSFSRPWAYR